MWERNFRVKTPARIHEEMRRLSKGYGLKSFGLAHDNFTTSHRYVAEFCGHFEKHNVEGFTWSSSARPDTLNLERIQSLYRAGCRGVFLGVDSGSDRIQKAIRKNLNLNHYRATLKETVSLDMEVTSSFILGFPEETEEDLNRTLLLALESRLMGAANVQFHRLAPLAGTPVLERGQSSLSLRSGPSDVSLLPIPSHEVDLFIERHPQLFSSFYSVRTPHVENINVSALAVFCSALINYAAPVLERTLKALGSTPTELFDVWMNWRENRYSENTIEESFVLNTFGQFIRSLFSSDLKKPTRFSDISRPNFSIHFHSD